MAPADPASRAGAMPEASGDWSSGTFGNDMTPLSKATAYRIEALESARLICFKHHIPWADAQIALLGKPPTWILHLSATKYIGDVQRILKQFVFSEPFEQMDVSQYYNDYLASLILRYRRRDLSWASFLDAAGRFTDCSDGGERPCEYFFGMLNDLEDADFSPELESLQSKKIDDQYSNAVDAIMPLYLEFRQYYPKPK